MSNAGGTTLVFTIDATEDELIAELQQRGWEYQEFSRNYRNNVFPETKLYRVRQLQKKTEDETTDTSQSSSG